MAVSGTLSPRGRPRSPPTPLPPWAAVAASLIAAVRVSGQVTSSTTTVMSTATTTSTTTTTTRPSVGVMNLTVYRSSSWSYATDLRNANAADVNGEIGFLTEGCFRRRRRQDGATGGSAGGTTPDTTPAPSPPGAYSPCDATDVIGRFHLQINATFTTYTLMNGGDCGGPCGQVYNSTGGLVGREPALGGYGGFWYSFQALSQCGPNQEVGDGGCAWKVVGEVRLVAVCCVNLRDRTVFLESFDRCPSATATSGENHTLYEPCRSTTSTTPLIHTTTTTSTTVTPATHTSSTTTTTTTTSLPHTSVLRLTLYRAAPYGESTSLANANAADAWGESSTLANWCSTPQRRARRQGSTPTVVATCDGSDVLSKYTVSVNSSFSCYVSMSNRSCNGGVCPFGTPRRDQACVYTDCFTRPWNTCAQAFNSSGGGLVGRTHGNMGRGFFYSFLGASECGPTEQVGDNGCTWKVEDPVRSVPVCCLDIRNATTFMESFDACPDAGPNSSSYNNHFGFCLPPTRAPVMGTTGSPISLSPTGTAQPSGVPTASAAPLPAINTTASPTASAVVSGAPTVVSTAPTAPTLSSQPTSGPTTAAPSPSAVASEAPTNGRSTQAPVVQRPPTSATAAPTTTRQPSAAGRTGSSNADTPRARESTDEDAAIGIAVAVIIALGVVGAAFYVWRPEPDTTAEYHPLSTQQPNAVYEMASSYTVDEDDYAAAGQ